MPTSGQITYINEPSGSGIRVDSALYQDMWVTTDYDSLIAKLIVWGEDRTTAIRRMIGAIDDFQIVGVTTDLGYLRDVVRSESFLSSAGGHHVPGILPVGGTAWTSVSWKRKLQLPRRSSSII